MGAKYNAHSEPLFKHLEILPLPKLILYFNLKFMHDYKYGFLPSAFLTYWPTVREFRNTKVDDLELRNDLDLFTPVPRLVSTARFPFFNLPQIWNTFDHNFPQISIIWNRQKFRLNLKTQLLSKLNTNPQCGCLFCFICSSIT